MNGYASLPWWLRYVFPAAICTVAGITNPDIPWWGDIGIFVGIYLACMIFQACVDGWHPSKW